MLLRSLTMVSIVLAGSLVPGLSTPARGQQRRKLNGPLETNYLAQVERYAIANGRIVYEAGTGLYSAGVSGSVPITEIAGGISRLWHLTPDGAVAVVQATVPSGDTELCSVATDGSGALLPLTAMDAYARGSKVSPDGAWVVFQRNGSVNLYAVPTDGSAATVLLSAASGAYSYEITSDSQRVVFHNANHTRVFSVPIAGGSPPVLLHPPSAGVLAVDAYHVSPDGTRVVMSGDLDEVNVVELYSAPADGSGPFVTLNEPLVGGSTLVPYVCISPDAANVTYAADYGAVGFYTLFVVPSTGGASIALDPASAPRAILEQVISPDGERVVYRLMAGSVTELFSVPLDASAAPVELNGSLGAGEDVAADFRIDRDSARVLFRVVGDGGSTGRLYSAPLDGSAPPVEISPALPSGQGVRSDGFQLGAARVAFLVDATIPDALELWSAPLDGSSAAMRLHPELEPGRSLSDFVLNKSGNRALFRGDKDIDGLIELYIVPLDGSLNPALRSINREETTTVGDVYTFKLAPDGATAVYHASEAAGHDLFAVNLAGSPQPVRLHALEILPFALSSFLLTPDSGHVVYGDSVAQALFSVPVDASEAAQEIVPSTGVRVVLARASPDSSRVVYLTEPNDVYGSATDAIFSVPVDGSSPPVELNAPRAVDGEVSAAEVTSDSSRVVYLGEQDTAGVVELYSAPVAGGAVPVRLNDALPVGGDVRALKLCPDASRVAYLADQQVDEIMGLYSVPVAGGPAPTPLTVMDDASREIELFEVGPDSALVVYAADEVEDERFGIYAVPVAGGSAPTELALLPAGYEAIDLWISPDSQWVVYHQYQFEPELDAIYSVPLAGGAPPVLLATPAGLVLAITPDSRAVVFVNSRFAGGLLDLFGVPIEGGPARQLNGGLPLSTLDVKVDSGSRLVLFHSDPNVPNLDELFVAPLSGGLPPFAVAGPPEDSSPTTQQGRFQPDTRSVVYMTEQDEAGVMELYIHELLARPAHHRPR